MSRSNSNQVGRSNFRSLGGCCICGTKSSSSRFTNSQRYSDHFLLCFGRDAENREGDLCNACVLCVKRWLQRGKTPDFFAKVLDSKKGPGPKHMKEITKRARRREDRAKAAQLAKDKPVPPIQKIKISDICKDPAYEPMSSGNHSSLPNSPKYQANQPDNEIKPTIINGTVNHPKSTQNASVNPQWNDNDSSDFTTSRSTRRSSQQNQCSSYKSSVVTRSSNVNSYSNSTESSPYTQTSDSSMHFTNGHRRKKVVSNTGSFTSSFNHNSFKRAVPIRRSMRQLQNYIARSVNSKRNVPDNYDSISWVHHASLINGYNELFVNCCCSRQNNNAYFNPSPNWDRSNAFMDDHVNSSSRLLRSSVNASSTNQYAQYDISSQSSACSNTSSSMLRTRASRYNRRVILPPVRMCVNEETDQLLRQIMEKNSEALDAREVHMAVQRKLRNRNRSSLNCGGTTNSTCSSSQCGHVSSANITTLNAVHSNNHVGSSSFTSHHHLNSFANLSNDSNPTFSIPTHENNTSLCSNNQSLSNSSLHQQQNQQPHRCSSLNSSDVLSLANLDSASSSTFGDAWSPAPQQPSSCSYNNNNNNGVSFNNRRNSSQIKTMNNCGNCWCCYGPNSCTTNNNKESLSSLDQPSSPHQHSTPQRPSSYEKCSNDLQFKTVDFSVNLSSSFEHEKQPTCSDQISISIESSLSSGFIDDSLLSPPPPPIVLPVVVNPSLKINR